MSIRKKMQEFKRELILEEAGKLFNQDGYEEMKISDLAKAAGVSVGTIYTLFGSKENLYNNYIISQIEHYSEVIHEELERCEDPLSKIKILVEIKYGAMSKNRNAIRESVINDPTFFLQCHGEDNPLLQMYAFIAEDVMKPLAFDMNSSKSPLELVYLFDGLTIGYIKGAVVLEMDLMTKVDETVENFLKLVREDR